MVEPTKRVLLTGAFWADTLERVVTAVASVALSLIGTDALLISVNFDWKRFGWVVLMTAVIRTLLCVVARTTGDKSVPNASFFLASGKQVEAPVHPAGEGPVNGPVRG